MVKSKVYAGSKDQDLLTDVLIYNLSSGELLYDSRMDKVLDKPFQDVQLGFFMHDNASDPEDSSVHFTIKCKATDYQIYFTKKGPEVQYERSAQFSRFNKHMIFPQSLEITIDRIAETFNQAFFLQKMSGRVNFIYPMHSSKEENISSDIKNRQEEVSKHIESKFLQNESGKVVYQDSEFAFMESDEFRELILSEIDPKTGF